MGMVDLGTWGFSAALASALLVGCAPSADSTPEEDTSTFITVENPIANEYIVVLNSQELGILSVRTMGEQIAQDFEVQVARDFETVSGFLGIMSEEEARALVEDDRVVRVEQNGRIQVSAVQEDAPWHLDRIDQTSPISDGTYTYTNSGGAGVHVYVIDTGILESHVEFEGRVGAGFDVVDGDQDPTDCEGHGTHVAGIAVGSTYGVAKQATVHGVRVLDCNGAGTVADVIAGIDWVTANHQAPAVANLSLGGSPSPTLDDSVRRALARGVFVTLAAGNGQIDACNTSPARVQQEAITVGASDPSDARAVFSNTGSCIDIFAPGTNVTSAGIASDTDSSTMSGTSMAAPQVAGTVALFLGENSEVRPEEVRNTLFENGLRDALTDVGEGSPNVLLNVSFLNSDGPGTDPGPTDPEPNNPDENAFSYDGVDTDDAKRDTFNQPISLQIGETLIAGTCGLEGSELNGDTYLRLFDEQGEEVTKNDDACGGDGSQIIYTAHESGTFELRAGCRRRESCSGTVTWLIRRDG